MPYKFLHGLCPEIFATNLFKDPLFLSMEKEIIGWSMQREVFTSMVPKIGVKFLTIFENKSHFLALKNILESTLWIVKVQTRPLGRAVSIILYSFVFFALLL